MKSRIIKIGNSKGVRIPKAFLEEGNISGEVEIKLESGKIIVEPIKQKVDEAIIMSHSALTDWDNETEDEAWAHLQ